jgi:hypothetical protein
MSFMTTGNHRRGLMPGGGVGVRVRVAVPVAVDVAVGVCVGVDVLIAVATGVRVCVEVAVLVAVATGVSVCVDVGVCVGTGPGAGIPVQNPELRRYPALLLSPVTPCPIVLSGRSVSTDRRLVLEASHSFRRIFVDVEERCETCEI